MKVWNKIKTIIISIIGFLVLQRIINELPPNCYIENCDEFCMLKSNGLFIKRYYTLCHKHYTKIYKKMVS